jgi:hypothetical protein
VTPVDLLEVDWAVGQGFASKPYTQMTVSETSSTRRSPECKRGIHRRGAATMPTSRADRSDGSVSASPKITTR